MATYGSEYYLHKSVVEYLQRLYPDAWFQSDRNGVNIPNIRTRALLRALQPHKGLDIFIAEPRQIDGCMYSGLFVELKLEVYGKSGYRLKNGDIAKNAHIQEQWQTILRLRDKGYQADFAGGWDEAISLIDGYLGGQF